ncbi:MAG TPA: hypothetical protein VFO16_12640 [Pseudonocardiaceae bacterium]|nr:hypothetical protein [Pseudonocardiaceae bacterium]
MTVPPLRAESRPGEVGVSFWLWISAVVLGALGFVVSSLQVREIRDQAIQQMLSQRPEMDPATFERIMTIVIGVFFLIRLLFLVLETVFAFLMRGGRDWARIVLTVFGAMTIAGELISLPSTRGLELVLGLIQLALVIGAIVYMYLPAANTWFQPRPAGF